MLTVPFGLNSCVTLMAVQMESCDAQHGRFCARRRGHVSGGGGAKLLLPPAGTKSWSRVTPANAAHNQQKAKSFRMAGAGAEALLAKVATAAGASLLLPQGTPANGEVDHGVSTRLRLLRLGCVCRR